MTHKKTLEHGDESGVKFSQEMLNGDGVGGFNVDTFYFSELTGWIIFELLKCDEKQVVTPYTSHPKNYWHKDKNKFLALYALKKSLKPKARLFLINYADAGTKAADEVLMIEVLKMNKEGITEEKVQKLTRREFSSKLRALNKLCRSNGSNDLLKLIKSSEIKNEIN